MRSACTALVLLLMYLVLVFLTFRVHDLFLLWQQGVPSTGIVDPILLSVRQLKQLLEVRGVSYTGYVEKKELANLVEESADVVQGEIDELNEVGGCGGADSERGRLSTTPYPSYFTGAAHFYEEVEDTKDSVWLVQVVPGNGQSKEPLLDDYTWTVVRSQVAPFAIRTGIFDCRLDRRLCSSKGWYEPLLLLALPRGTKPKDRVVMRTCKLTRPHAILEWLREELSIRVKKISTYEDVEKDWLDNVNANSSEAKVKVLLLTQLLHPPLFLAALSIKFTGRISFGIFSVKKEDMLKTGKVPLYLVITPEKTVIYGQRKQEHFNLRSMNAFLKVVQPEMNDVFLTSLLIMNMFAVFLALQVPLESWWRILVVIIWTVVASNLFLFAFWLILLGSLRWPSVSLMGDRCASVVRTIALSDYGSLMRADWLRLTRWPWALLSTLVVFALVVTRRFKSTEHPSTPSNHRRWWEIDCLFRPPATSVTEIELEQDLEMLIEHLAVPNFWLQPVIPTDYIKDLYVWKYRGQKSARKDSPEVIQKIMDSKDDAFVTKVSQSESDLKLTDSEPEEFLIKTHDCAICLEKYRSGVLLCALPCGHNYHQKCISSWLQRDKHHCPVCRWPANKSKNAKAM